MKVAIERERFKHIQPHNEHCSRQGLLIDLVIQDGVLKGYGRSCKDKRQTNQELLTVEHKQTKQFQAIEQKIILSSVTEH